MQQGGLRTKGVIKRSIEGKPLISIVTVVYNNEVTLEDTIVSVICQTYDNIQYIIVDGNSSDKTLDIILKYEDRIDYWISESDEGIYDAMNKGISQATGDWILLLNSDDILLNSEVITNVSCKLINSNASIVHANIYVCYPNGKMRKNIPSAEKNLRKGMCLNHGTCFVTSKLYKVRLYNTSYLIAADYDFLLWSYLNGYKFEYIDNDIIKYSAQGLTGSPSFGNLDAYKIWKNYFGRLKAICFFLKDFSPKLLKMPVKKILIKLKLY